MGSLRRRIATFQPKIVWLWPFYELLRCSYHIRGVKSIGGIKLVEMGHNDQSNAAFLQVTADALKLI